MQFRIYPCVYIYMTSRTGAWFIRFLYISFFPWFFIILIIKCTLCDTPCGRHHRRRLNNKTVFTTRIWRREQHNILWIFIRYVLPMPLTVCPRIRGYIILLYLRHCDVLAPRQTPRTRFSSDRTQPKYTSLVKCRGVKDFDVPLLCTYIYSRSRARS